MPAAETHDRNGLAVLTRKQCLEFLRVPVVGRVGLTIDALPAILPVNYALMGDDVVIRTGWGAKLQAATDRQVVCFEADGFDPVSRTGWSVLVTGRAEVIGDPEHLTRARALPLEPWAPAPRDQYVLIRTELISGRRVGSAPGVLRTEDDTAGPGNGSAPPG